MECTFRIRVLPASDSCAGHVLLHPSQVPEAERVELISHSKKSVILAPTADEKVAIDELKVEKFIKDSFFKNESEVKVRDWQEIFENYWCLGRRINYGL